MSTQTLGGGTAVSLRKYWTGSLPWDAGASEDVIITLADQLGPCDVRTLSQRSNLSEAEVLARLSELTEQGEVVALGELGVQADAVVYSRRGWDIVRNQAQVALQTYHNQYPLRKGAPPQQLRSRLNWPQPVYVRAAVRLADEGFAIEDGRTDTRSRPRD